jgi:CPA2 family monovalent cation:H+ antiporter-2
VQLGLSARALFVRSYDRIHSIALRNRNVDYELRETLESGLLFGRKTLEALGVSEIERLRDRRTTSASATNSGWCCRRPKACRPAATCCYSTGPVKPEPLVKPKRVVDFSQDPLAGTADAVADA